jgi:hypothetical protein
LHLGKARISNAADRSGGMRYVNRLAALLFDTFETLSADTISRRLSAICILLGHADNYERQIIMLLRSAGERADSV